MKILLTLLILLLSSSVFAEQSTVVGGVSNDCDKTLELIDSLPQDLPVNVNDMIQQSILGFLSGINAYYNEIKGSYKNLWHDDIDYIYSYVINYCKQNPKGNLMEASLEYLLTLPDYE